MTKKVKFSSTSVFFLIRIEMKFNSMKTIITITIVKIEGAFCFQCTIPGFFPLGAKTAASSTEESCEMCCFVQIPDG